MHSTPVTSSDLNTIENLFSNAKEFSSENLLKESNEENGVALLDFLRLVALRI